MISVGVTRRCSIHQRASSLCFLLWCFPQARNWSSFSPHCLFLCCISHIRPIYFSEASLIATRMMCTLLQPTRSYTNPCLLKAILVNSFENFLVHDSIAFLQQVSLQHVWCVNYYNPLVFKPTPIFWKQFCSIPLRISWFVIPFLWVDLILITMVSSVLVGCHGKLCFVIFCFLSNKNFFLYHVCLVSPRCTRL